jgi:hypothetical protein
MTSQLAALQRVPLNRGFVAGPKCGHPRQEAAPMGDRRSGARGSIDRAVVLVVRFGCRSRQAAFGPSFPSVKSRRITAAGLAFRGESFHGSEMTSEANP